MSQTIVLPKQKPRFFALLSHPIWSWRSRQKPYEVIHFAAIASTINISWRWYSLRGYENRFDKTSAHSEVRRKMLQSMILISKRRRYVTWIMDRARWMLCILQTSSTSNKETKWSEKSSIFDNSRARQRRMGNNIPGTTVVNCFSARNGTWHFSCLNWTLVATRPSHWWPLPTMNPFVAWVLTQHIWHHIVFWCPNDSICSS